MTVRGVHLAKFTAKKDSANARKAVLRYGIDNDCDFEIWKQNSMRAWPTLMFVDRKGNIIGKHEGEIDVEGFDKLLGDMVADFDAHEILRSEPLTYHLEIYKEWDRTLSCPGKVLADEASGRLIISDSNHNRILIAHLDGRQSTTGHWLWR